MRASEGVKALLSAVFVRTKAARITLPALADHPWTTAGGALPPVHIASAPLPGVHYLHYNPTPQADIQCKPLSRMFCKPCMETEISVHCLNVCC